MAKIVSTEMKDIPNYTKISEIRQKERIPSSRSIVEVTPRGVRQVPETEVTKSGGIYTDLPDYRRGVQNVARMMKEMAVLKNALSDDITIRYNHPDYSYILLEDYPLGYAYTPSSSHILIRIPPEYPQTPPGLDQTYGVYITEGLKWNGRQLECHEHQYHWTCEHNSSEMRENGWAWWCFAHFKDWNQYTDGLFKVLGVLTQTLQDPAKREW